MTPTNKLRVTVLELVAGKAPVTLTRLGLCHLLVCDEGQLEEVLDIVVPALDHTVLRWRMADGLKMETVVAKDKAKATNVREVFDYWVARTSRNPRQMKLTNDRRRKVNARLSEGYTVADLKKAVDGIMMSTFHVEKGFTDLVHVCRSAAHVDGFIEKSSPKQSDGGFRNRLKRAGRTYDNGR